MAYNDPETAANAAPPPLDAPKGADNYGWQGQAPNPPQQPYQQPAGGYQQPAGGYQQPYQPYGQPAAGNYYPGPMAPATSGYAIASLVCSLLGYVGIFGFGPILGIIFGHMAIREIDRSNGALQGRGMAQAGLILGYIALGLALLALLIFTVIFIVGVASSTVAPN